MASSAREWLCTSFSPAGPEETTLYQVVADNLATLYDAVDDGALAIALPKFVKK